MTFKSNLAPKNQRRGFGLPPKAWQCPDCGVANREYMARCTNCKATRPVA